MSAHSNILEVAGIRGFYSGAVRNRFSQ